jgi:hypothetical protein
VSLNEGVFRRLTFELSGRHAVGAPLERGVRRHVCSSSDDCYLKGGPENQLTKE